MMKTLAILMTCLLLPFAAHAKAYFAPKTEMVSNSTVVAVVEITEVKALEPNVHYGDQQVSAKVQETLAGSAGDRLAFRVPCFFPCAITQVTNGTYLVFLAMGKDGLQGNNWQLSYRPVKDGKIEWYKADPPHELEWRDRETVLNEVRKLIKASPATGGTVGR